MRDLDRARAVKIPRSLLTTDWQSVIEDPAVNLIESNVIGGTTIARTVVLNAFKQGANPSSQPTRRCFPRMAKNCSGVAQRFGVNLYYEASVAGGIPIIKVLREGLIGNRITRIYREGYRGVRPRCR